MQSEDERDAPLGPQAEEVRVPQVRGSANDGRQRKSERPAAHTILLIAIAWNGFKYYLSYQTPVDI